MTEGKRSVKQASRPLRLSLDERVLLLFWWSRSLEKSAWYSSQSDLHGHLPAGARSMAPPAAAPASLAVQGWPGEAEAAMGAQAPVPPWPTGPQASAAAA